MDSSRHHPQAHLAPVDAHRLVAGEIEKETEGVAGLDDEAIGRQILERLRMRGILLSAEDFAEIRRDLDGNLDIACHNNAAEGFPLSAEQRASARRRIHLRNGLPPPQ